MPTTITRTAREVLASDATVCDGNALTISGKLAPGEYAEVKRVLEAAGAKWNKRAQAHLFADDAAAALARLLEGERVVSATEAEQWFPTPPGVVARLLELAGLEAGMEVLEPSAGTGAIAAAMLSAGCVVDCVELNADRAAALAGMRHVTAGDFLAVPPRAAYDRVVMNPPFARLADTRHVMHALRFVRSGGLLVAVMGSGVTSRSDGMSARIRDMAARPGGTIIALPAGSFRDAGTAVSTVIVVLPVPGEGQTEVAAPVRVTFDRTAEGVPLFNPATARPGTYVHRDAWRGADAVFRFAGNCTGCGARTWRHDHGGDDVRGPFGDHTAVPITDEDLRGEIGGEIPEDVSFPRCATCWNEYEGYRKALDRAVAQFRAQEAAKRAPATLF